MEIIGSIAAVFAIIGTIWSVYAKFVRPRTTKTHFKKLLGLVERWFDEIDCNLENGLNMSKLNNMENKIREHVENKLNRFKLKPSSKLICEWNRKMGLKKELENSLELFKKYSRMPDNEVSLDLYINLLIGSFYTFHQAYQAKSSEANYADVEMPVKFLKFYMEAMGG